MKKTLLAAVVAFALILASLLAYRHFVLVRPLLEKVRETMNDPESAQFRNLRVISAWTPSDTVVCGEVNGKNRMGGYVGFKHFEVLGSDAVPDFEPESLTSMYDAGELTRCPYQAPWWGVPF